MNETQTHPERETRIYVGGCARRIGRLAICGALALGIGCSPQDTKLGLDGEPMTVTTRDEIDGITASVAGIEFEIDHGRCQKMHRFRADANLINQCYETGLFEPVAAQRFGPDAGFVSARDGLGVIRVASHPDLDVAAIIAGWNDLASREFLVIDELDPQITWRPHDSVNWVQAKGTSGYTGPYDHCVVNFAAADIPNLQHEIGHCLGFADHLTADQDAAPFTNPAVCDAAENALNSAYVGIMTYCDLGNPDRWWSPDDKLSLVTAGYINSM